MQLQLLFYNVHIFTKVRLYKVLVDKADFTQYWAHRQYDSLGPQRRKIVLK